MPIIRISHAAQYEQKIKDRILASVTEAYVAATGKDPASVWVIVEEVESSDWSVGGLSLAERRARG